MKAHIVSALKRRRHGPVLTASKLLLASYILVAIAAPLIAPQNPYDPLQIYGWEASSPPGT
ncbi:ABC transporter permease, partial [Sinorhizobium meliloti]